MATYILFWNPDFSSYTKDRFLTDFAGHDGVGNWSFHEHGDVKAGDIFYMIKCGQEPRGVVMRGEIASKCYESVDWSPKNRKHIFYADIDTSVCINPWSGAKLLTPEKLTEAIPDFNWFGGHAGRRLDDEAAKRLDDIWFEYLDTNPVMFRNGKAWVDNYLEFIMPARVQKAFIEKADCRCEICGYSYTDVFGKETVEKEGLHFGVSYIIRPSLKRLFYVLCPNCCRASDKILGKLLKTK